MAGLQRRWLRPSMVPNQTGAHLPRRGRKADGRRLHDPERLVRARKTTPLDHEENCHDWIRTELRSGTGWRTCGRPLTAGHPGITRDAKTRDPDVELPR